MNTEETNIQNHEAIQKFKDLVKDVNVCMFTTLDQDDTITSRPMFTVDIDEEGNAWFFTNEFSEKIQEVSKNNFVNLIYAHPGKNVYVNVKGTCTVIIDRKKMEELWKPDMQSWLQGGLDDPKTCLLKVHTETAYYWNIAASRMGVFFRNLKSMAKGESFEEGEKGKLSLDT